MDMVQRRLVSSMIRGIVLGAVKELSPRELKNMILGKIDEEEWIKQIDTDGYTIRILRKIAEEKITPELLDEWLTTEQILTECISHAPYLFPILNTFKGEKWLQKRIALVKKLILKVILT